MTQANNRQGQGGGELVPFIEGGGTESNRARAARGGPGPDVLSVYLDGQRIAGAPMDRVEVGVDHASGPDFTATQRVVVTPDGQRHAVNAPSQADLDGAKRAAPAQPDPAPGQVWAPPVGAVPSWVDVDGTVTIASDNTLDVPGLLWLVHGGTIVAGDLDGWTCIGVATPNGRVMVGDGFRASSGIQVEVTGVGPGDLLVRGSQEPTRGRFTPGHAEAATLLGWTRTRYAPARAGERYRDRRNGDVANGVPGLNHNPAQWERLDAGRRASAALAQACHEGAAAVRGLAANLRKLDPDGAIAARPEPLTLQAPAFGLRAIADAIGRALESTEPQCTARDGFTIRRDEMLFTPEIGEWDIAADTRALAVFRSLVLDAATNAAGAASLPQWGAKGPRVEVRRKGPAMVAAPAAEPAEAVRYTPSAGGADAWRWGGDGQ